MPSPYAGCVCDTLRVRRRWPQTSYNSGWTRVPYRRCLGGDRRLSIDRLCGCGRRRRGGILAGKGRNDDSPTIPWIRGRRRDNRGSRRCWEQRRGSQRRQWALIQELQTALPPAAHRARCRPHHPRRVPAHHQRPGEVLDGLRRRALRDLPAMDRRQKLLHLITERRIRAFDISADW